MKKWNQVTIAWSEQTLVASTDIPASFAGREYHFRSLNLRSFRSQGRGGMECVLSYPLGGLGGFADALALDTLKVTKRFKQLESGHFVLQGVTTEDKRRLLIQGNLHWQDRRSFCEFGLEFGKLFFLVLNIAPFVYEQCQNRAFSAFHISQDTFVAPSNTSWMSYSDYLRKKFQLPAPRP